MKIINFMTAAIACGMLSGCASRAANVQATYIAPIQYENHSCKQIRREMVRVSQKVSEISGVQDTHATGDAVAMGVGLVIFWPALFFLASSDQHVELASLKGQYDALQEAANEKDCDVAREINASKKREVLRVAKKTEETKETVRQDNNK